MRLGGPGKLAIAIGAASVLGVAGQAIVVGRGLKTAPATRSLGPHVALVDEYCLSCHDKDHEKGKLVLETVAADEVPAHPEIWEKVVRKLRARLMPPVGKDRPDEPTYDSVITFLEK